MQRRFFLHALLALSAVGCGQSSNPALSGGGPQSLTLTLGRTVVIAPGSLDRPASLTSPPPQVLPPLHRARAVGSAFRLNLGTAESIGPIQVVFPELGQGNLEVLAVIEGSDQYLPLLIQGTTATLDVGTAQVPDLGAADQDGRDIHFVLAEPESSSSYRVWNTYNGYVFELNGNGQAVRRPLVVGGVLQGALPNLGSRPLMLVHGLGDTIRADSRWTDLAQRFLNNGVASGVVAFEYDTQDSCANNGAFLRQYYSLLGAQKQWRHLAHSMGCVVSRCGFESGNLPIQASSNKAFFLSGPHIGSPAISVLQGSLTLSQRVFRYMVLNGFLTFENVDGSSCDVDTQRAGFSDLRSDSPLLRQLNNGAAGRHPQLDYATLGGNRRGFSYWFLDYMMGITLDDGLVNLPSANFTGMGSLQSNTAPVDHSEAITESSSLNQATNFLLP